MKAYYFGTTLTEAGHYHHDLYQNGISKNYTREGDLPFYCERFPIARKGIGVQNGTVAFYNIGYWSICAIQGSPKDTRPGSKSIFYFDEPLTQDQMIKLLKSLPIFNKIIEQMPFPVEIFKPKTDDTN
jgi:hypothetical protein